MKRIVQIIAAMAAIASITGCATPYMTDRGRDAADIFTLAGGWGFGAKARASVLNIGLYGGEEKTGLRGGRILGEEARAMDFTATLPFFTAPHMGTFGMHSLEWLATSKEQYSDESRGKDYQAWGFYVPGITGFMGKYGLTYYTQVELAVGLGPSLRLGFNPGDFLDFLLGWAGIDIYGDDIEAKKAEEQSGKSQKAIGKPKQRTTPFAPQGNDPAAASGIK